MIQFFKKKVPEAAAPSLSQFRSEDIEWFEVWYEELSTFPFNFLLLAKEKNAERYLIFDIYNQDKLLAEFTNHYDAHMFLLEDEFSRLEGRTYQEDF